MFEQTIDITEARADSRKAYLIPLDGKEPLTIDGIVSVGRDATSDLCLNDPHISSVHCRFEKRPAGFFIRDLESKNGVKVNGLRVTEAQLLNGSHIQIATKDFLFQTEEPTPTEMPLKSRNLDWQRKLQSLIHLAKTDLPVFLQGESGTGKEVVANLIHDLSPRGEAPFTSVNCSALTETLVESELFGHVKGSFTGATSDRKGAFEAARGGTLFLDEIGDLPPSLQPKLLRALENKEIRPVGSDRIFETDVRIITATHKNLEHMVAEKNFRADLYFRIHVVKIAIPGLRERMEDFEDILYHYCRELRVRFSPAAIDELKKHSWPGNIRELRNSVARAQALFPQTYIQPEHVKDLIDRPFPENPSALQSLSAITAKSGQPSVLKEVEKEIIKARLIVNNGNQRRTAAELGMPKSTLHDRIKAYNIEIKSLIDV